MPMTPSNAAQTAAVTRSVNERATRATRSDCTIYEIGRDAGETFIAMELLNGMPEPELHWNP